MSKLIKIYDEASLQPKIGFKKHSLFVLAASCFFSCSVAEHYGVIQGDSVAVATSTSAATSSAVSTSTVLSDELISGAQIGATITEGTITFDTGGVSAVSNGSIPNGRLLTFDTVSGFAAYSGTIDASSGTTLITTQPGGYQSIHLLDSNYSYAGPVYSGIRIDAKAVSLQLLNDVIGAGNGSVKNLGATVFDLNKKYAWVTNGLTFVNRGQVHGLVEFDLATLSATIKALSTQGLLNTSLATSADIDGDGIANSQDWDMDEDGLVNLFDTDDDNDGIPDQLDADADGDGVVDTFLVGDTRTLATDSSGTVKILSVRNRYFELLSEKSACTTAAAVKSDFKTNMGVDISSDVDDVLNTAFSQLSTLTHLSSRIEANMTLKADTDLPSKAVDSAYSMQLYGGSVIDNAIMTSTFKSKYASSCVAGSLVTFKDCAQNTLVNNAGNSKLYQISLTANQGSNFRNIIKPNTVFLLGTHQKVEGLPYSDSYSLMLHTMFNTAVRNIKVIDQELNIATGLYAPVTHKASCIAVAGYVVTPGDPPVLNSNAFPLTITWDPPLDTNGNAMAGLTYFVEVVPVDSTCSLSGTAVTTSTTSTSFQIAATDGLDASKSYYLRITAKNTDVEGSFAKTIKIPLVLNPTDPTAIVTSCLKPSTSEYE